MVFVVETLRNQDGGEGNNVTPSFLNLPQSTPGGEIKQLPKLPPEIGAIKQMFQPGYPNYPPKTEGRPKTGTFSVSRLVSVLIALLYCIFLPEFQCHIISPPLLSQY